MTLITNPIPEAILVHEQSCQPIDSESVALNPQVARVAEPVIQSLARRAELAQTIKDALMLPASQVQSRIIEIAKALMAEGQGAEFLEVIQEIPEAWRGGILSSLAFSALEKNNTPLFLSFFARVPLTNERSRLLDESITFLLERASSGDEDIIVQLLSEASSNFRKSLLQGSILSTWLCQNLSEDNPFRCRVIAALEERFPTQFSELSPQNQIILNLLRTSPLSKSSIVAIYEQLLAESPARAISFGLAAFPAELPFLEKMFFDFDKNEEACVYHNQLFDHLFEQRLLPRSLAILKKMPENSNLLAEMNKTVSRSESEAGLKNDEMGLFIRQMVHAKRLALAWGIESRPDALFKYEESLHGPGLLMHLGEYFSRPGLQQNKAMTRLATTLRSTADNMQNIPKAAEKVLKGKTIILPAGWKGHAIALIFHKGSVYVCNRGAGLEVVRQGKKLKAQAMRIKIDRKEMTVQKMASILRRCAEVQNLSAEEGEAFYREEFPRLLSSKPQKDSENSDQSSMQKVCNCGSASRDQAFLQAYRLFTGDSSSRVEAKKKLLEYKMSLIENYLQSVSEGDLTYDAHLVQFVQNKLNKKINKLGRSFRRNELPEMLAEMPHVSKLLASSSFRFACFR